MNSVSSGKTKTQNMAKKQNNELAQMEAMRQSVIEQELVARSWKAHWEKMYYTIESEKIEEEYKQSQERMRIKTEEERAKIEALLAELKAGEESLKEEPALTTEN